MKLNTFLTIKSVISIVVGLCCFLLPVTFMQIYGVSLDKAGNLMAQYFGAIIMGAGLICWVDREAEKKALRGIVLSLFIADSLGFLVSLMAQLSGLVNSFGWVNVAIWLFLSLGLGYYRFIQKST